MRRKPSAGSWPSSRKPRSVLGAGALIAAGFGFGVFWGSGLLSFDAPWSAGLALHGLWMGALGVGVIRLVQPLRGAAAAIGWAGAATTIIGMLTAFPIFGVGLILIATSEWLRGTRRPAAGALAAGAFLLLASLPLEGRFDGSGTPEPGTPAGLLFAPAICLISLGLTLLGVRLLQTERRHATVALAR
jgi:hypothetical protein